MKLMEYLRGLLSYMHSAGKHRPQIGFQVRELAFLVPYLKKNSIRYLGLFFLLLLGSGLSLPGPAITGVIIDKVFFSKDARKLDLFVGLLLAILLVSEIVRLVQDYATMRLSQEFTYSVRSHLIERILKFPLAFFNEFQTGYLVSRLDEVGFLGGFFSANVPALAESAIRFAGAFFLISRYNLKLTLISVLVLPLFFEVARRSVASIRATTLGTMETSAKVRGKIQETLSGIEVVKTFAKENQEASAIKSGLRNIIELEILQNLFSSVSGRILGVITGVNLLVILWVGGHEIIAGRLTVGQYVAFVAYIGYIYGPIQMFAVTFLQFQRTAMACKRISEFQDKVAEDESPARTREFSHLQGSVRFAGVSYHYANDKEALRDINLSIRAGEKVALVGKSGAGKSTLVHLALGLHEPTLGRIEIDGIDLQTVRLESLRSRIGIVSQNIFLFDDSLLNNIRYCRPEASTEDVLAAARAAGCHAFISGFPAGYEANAGEIGNRLSGGEKQRISIARCLLKNPDLVIFDEPTAHLDREATKKMIASIEELFCDKTCIIISHHLDNINWVDRVFVLEEGRLVQEGTPADLIRTAGKYQDLFGETSAVTDRLVS